MTKILLSNSDTGGFVVYKLVDRKWSKVGQEFPTLELAETFALNIKDIHLTGITSSSRKKLKPTI